MSCPNSTAMFWKRCASRSNPAASRSRAPRREAELGATVRGEPSSAIRAGAARARETQLARQHKPNALLGTREIDRHCATNRDGDQLLRHALARLLLSARAYHRVLRVARSIADLCGKNVIAAEPVAAALQYRRLAASF